MRNVCKIFSGWSVEIVESEELVCVLRMHHGFSFAFKDGQMSC